MPYYKKRRVNKRRSTTRRRSFGRRTRTSGFKGSRTYGTGSRSYSLGSMNPFSAAPRIMSSSLPVLPFSSAVRTVGGATNLMNSLVPAIDAGKQIVSSSKELYRGEFFFCFLKKKN